MPNHHQKTGSPLYWPASQLIADYRSGVLSPVEVLDEAIHRIDAFNPTLNAFLSRQNDMAREQAIAAERAYQNNEAGPLCGVPVSIKDTFHINGMVTTFGSRAYEDNLVDYDSGVVKRLRASGAVFTGKTNTAEFGQSATTENRFAIDCRNPWNIECTTGGSSGGAAASVAAGLSTLAVGADGGGSIRIPAAFTGVFGIKPTYGFCKDEGGGRAMSDFISPGPFSRCVADSRLMLSVLADAKYQRDSLGPLRIAWCPRPGNWAIDPEVLEVTQRAVMYLESMGHDIVETDLPLDGWSEAFAPLVLAEEHRERSHLLKECPDVLTGYERKTLEIAANVTSDEVDQARQNQQVYSQRIENLFKGYDLILLPTTSVPAFPIKQRPKEIGGQEVDWLWGAFPATAPFNVSGNPAATLPCGMVGELPVGLQIVGPHLGEALILDLAEDLEQAINFDYSSLMAKWSLAPETV